jgi:hypothetical protein
MEPTFSGNVVETKAIRRTNEGTLPKKAGLTYIEPIAVDIFGRLWKSLSRGQGFSHMDSNFEG